ncbi:MAG: nucleoside 2-deoxyribosyltransferase [Sedimentisphaerales bacterium]|nr:nucleoside 2-deoxyribosyltransferase [Sedimentisphaerales bacterium]
MLKDNHKKNRMYLAGPLFSLAERTFNHNLKQLLNPFFEVYLPQEDGGLLVYMIKAGMPAELAKEKVFDVDVRAMNECDLVLIILDGRTVDEGAAFELGFAYAKGKQCYGLKTGPRQLLAIGNNPMIDIPLERIFVSIEELIDWAKSYSGQDTCKDDNEEKKSGVIRTETV